MPSSSSRRWRPSSRRAPSDGSRWPAHTQDADRTDLAVTTLSRAAERFPDTVVIYATLGEVWLHVAEARSDRVALGKAVEALRAAVLRGGSTSP
jgi:hypothetical protein